MSKDGQAQREHRKQMIRTMVSKISTLLGYEPNYAEVCCGDVATLDIVNLKRILTSCSRLCATIATVYIGVRKHETRP
jgi:hypothetical protein